MIFVKLFGKKEKQVQEPKDARKDEIESRLEDIRGSILEKTRQLEETASRLAEVKKEYDCAVSDLMAVKKEANEEKNTVESLQRQQRVARTRIKEAQDRYKQEAGKITEIEKASARLQQIKNDIALGAKNREDIQKEIAYAQAKLSDTDTRRVGAEDQYQAILEKINGAKSTLHKTQPAPQKTDGSPKNIVEAASTVVASMRTKLDAAQKETEVVKQMLAKEREEHKLTKDKLDKIKSK